jgi:hypothetical protein
MREVSFRKGWPTMRPAACITHGFPPNRFREKASITDSSKELRPARCLGRNDDCSFMTVQEHVDDVRGGDSAVDEANTAHLRPGERLVELRIKIAKSPNRDGTLIELDGELLAQRRAPCLPPIEYRVQE